MIIFILKILPHTDINVYILYFTDNTVTVCINLNNIINYFLIKKLLN